MYGKSEDRDDYQHVPRPLAAMARDLPDGHHIPPHRHRRHQLLYGTTGAITVTTPHGTWVVPATRAAWLPAGLTHAMTCAGAVALRTLYVDPAAAGHLTAAPAVVPVSPLLRELIDEATRIPVAYDPDGRDGALMRLLLLQLAPNRSPRCTSRRPATPSWTRSARPSAATRAPAGPPPTSPPAPTSAPADCTAASPPRRA